MCNIFTRSSDPRRIGAFLSSRAHLSAGIILIVSGKQGDQVRISTPRIACVRACVRVHAACRCTAVDGRWTHARARGLVGNKLCTVNAMQFVCACACLSDAHAYTNRATHAVRSLQRTCACVRACVQSMQRYALLLLHVRVLSLLMNLSNMRGCGGRRSGIYNYTIQPTGVV